MCTFMGTVSFTLTWSSAYAEFNFDNVAANFGTNGRWRSAVCPKTVENSFLPTKKISSPWTSRLLFWRSLLKMFDDGPICFCALSENEVQIINFFLIFFLKLFLWTGGMQFRQSLQNYLARRRGNVHSLSENDTKF